MANGFSDFLFGSPERVDRTPLYDNDTLGAIKQARQMGLKGLQDPMAGFQPIAQKARQNFGQHGIPSIAERFTKYGNQNSSSFQNALGGSLGDFESNLAALGSEYGRGQQQHFSNLLNAGTQRTFENTFRPATSGILEKGFNSLISAAPWLGAAYFSGNNNENNQNNSGNNFDYLGRAASAFANPLDQYQQPTMDYANQARNSNYLSGGQQQPFSVGNYSPLQSMQQQQEQSAPTEASTGFNQNQEIQRNNNQIQQLQQRFASQQAAPQPGVGISAFGQPVNRQPSQSYNAFNAIRNAMGNQEQNQIVLDQVRRILQGK